MLLNIFIFLDFFLCVSPKWYHIRHATLYPDHLIYNAKWGHVDAYEAFLPPQARLNTECSLALQPVSWQEHEVEDKWWEKQVLLVGKLSYIIYFLIGMQNYAEYTSFVLVSCVTLTPKDVHLTYWLEMSRVGIYIVCAPRL